MRLHNLGDRVKSGLTSWGCMWNQGRCSADTEYVLRNEDGSAQRMQSRVTAFWPDGSVKWTAHTADAGKLSEVIEVVPADGECQRKGEPEVEVKRLEGQRIITAGSVAVVIPDEGKWLFERLEVNGELRAGHAGAVLILEEPANIHGRTVRTEKEYEGLVERVTLEEEGPVRAVVKFEGTHVSEEGERKLPFVIRMMIGLESEKVDFVHTFLYDGDEERDFLKGIGLRLEVPMEDEMYNRHVEVQGDYGVFHETAAELLSWRPRLPEQIYREQMAGKRLVLGGNEKELVESVLKDMPSGIRMTYARTARRIIESERRRKGRPAVIWTAFMV